VFIFALLGAFFGFIAFWINLGFVLNVRSHVGNYTSNVWSGHIGNAFWLSFGGFMALSLAVCFAGVASFSEEERRDRDTAGVPAVHERLGGRWPRVNRVISRRTVIDQANRWQERRHSAAASEASPVAAYPANASV
jgi:hypothetical protein